MRLPNKTAFSLIEISIVIVIIAILIVGSLNGVEMIRKARLTAAQSLTEQSIVAKINNLLVWYETSLNRSFIEAERDNGLKISKWRNINPSSLISNDATQNTVINQPTYYNNRFNGALPALNFDGNDFMNYIGSELINSSYSVFIVENRMSAGNLLTMVGGSSTTVNGNLILSYRNSTTITQAHYGNDLNYTIPAFSSPIVRMHSFLFNKTYGKKYWLNGGNNPKAQNSTQTSPLISYSNSWLGRYAGNYYFGDIAEIIIFKRSLTSEERKSVEEYLGKKYNIAIS